MICLAFSIFLLVLTIKPAEALQEDKIPQVEPICQDFGNISYCDFFTVEYTEDCSTRCIGDECTAVLGAPYWIRDSDGICKHISEATSWKDSGRFFCNVFYDGENYVECMDFNATSLTVKLKVDMEKEDKDVPLAIWMPNETKIKEKNDCTGDYKKDYIKIKDEKIKIKSSEDELIITEDFIIGMILEFGENSTTVVIGFNDSAIQHDGDVRSFDEANCYSCETGLMYEEGVGGSPGNGWTYIKGNLTAYLGVTVEKCDVQVYCSDATGHTTVYNVSDLSWEEASGCPGTCGSGGFSWNNKTMGDQLLLGPSAWSDTTFYNVSVNETCQNAVDGDGFFTIMFNQTSDANNNGQIALTEWSIGADKWPLIFLTYTEGATPTTYMQNLTAGFSINGLNGRLAGIGRNITNNIQAGSVIREQDQLTRYFTSSFNFEYLQRKAIGITKYESFSLNRILNALLVCQPGYERYYSVVEGWYCRISAGGGGGGSGGPEVPTQEYIVPDICFSCTPEGADECKIIMNSTEAICGYNETSGYCCSIPKYMYVDEFAFIHNGLMSVYSEALLFFNNQPNIMVGVIFIVSFLGILAFMIVKPEKIKKVYNKVFP